jgi:hypothetical protein
MGTISVEGKLVFPTGQAHMYLVYKDDAGKEFVIRGGPLNDLPPFGPLVTERGRPIVDSEDAREGESPAERGHRELPLGGRDAAEVWALAKQHAAAINLSGTSYNPFGANSNATIGNILYGIGNYDVRVYAPDIPGIAETYPSARFDLGIDYTIYGNPGHDRIYGQKGDQKFFGAGGDDWLGGGEGNDSLMGGAGSDMARYAGPAKEYRAKLMDDGSIQIHHSGRAEGARFDGTDRLYSMEWIDFAGVKYELSPDTLNDWRPQTPTKPLPDGSYPYPIWKYSSYEPVTTTIRE